MAKGRLVDRAEAVAQVLAARGIPLSPELYERLLACTDLDTLRRWLARAIVVSAAEDIFNENDC